MSFASPAFRGFLCSCKVACYCSKECRCQEVCWKEHKSTCYKSAKNVTTGSSRRVRWSLINNFDELVWSSDRDSKQNPHMVTAVPWGRGPPYRYERNAALRLRHLFMAGECALTSKWSAQAKRRQAQARPKKWRSTQARPKKWRSSYLYMYLARPRQALTW